MDLKNNALYEKGNLIRNFIKKNSEKKIGKICSLIFLFTTVTFAQDGNLFRNQIIGGKIDDLVFTDYISNVKEGQNFDDKFKVLEFWATWCRACLEAIPHLNELASEFENNPNLVFLACRI